MGQMGRCMKTLYCSKVEGRNWSSFLVRCLTGKVTFLVSAPAQCGVFQNRIIRGNDEAQQIDSREVYREQFRYTEMKYPFLAV